MSFDDDSRFVGQLIDAYATRACRMDVAADHPASTGVPPEMQVGEVDEEGWVEWRVMPSTLRETELQAFETEFGVQFPPVFRAYLLSRSHLFDQVHSSRYEQLIFMTATPAGRPLKPLRGLMEGWQPLIDAGFIPFAEWGDGWGPMCFDSVQRRADGDCPVAWVDHEVLVPLGPEEYRRRETVLPLMQPLYDSCRDFLRDIFDVT